MAEMTKIKSSVPKYASAAAAADLRETYSVSDFINDMPTKLCWSDNASIAHLKLFWSQDHHDQFNDNGGLESIMEKIKSAVKGLDIFRFPTLFQIWAPKTVGGQQFLVSSDLPFGISFLRKGLCLYRKLCLDYKYSLDGEEELGPVGRVFRDGFPEFSPFVTCYYPQEFKLRGCAESFGLYGYLALPVFEAAGKKCTCVLELISVFDGNYCLTDTIENVSQALKTIGLRTHNIHWLIDMERSSQHEFALSEIERDLKSVCQAHDIPFAQTWFVSKGENSTKRVMCTSEKGSSMLLKKVSSFQKDCIQFGLKEGQGVVWRAFKSCTSWFCRDVSQLSIKEYSLVLSARKVGLTAASAICLKSSFNGDDFKGEDTYVLEFFLPLKQTTSSKPLTYFVNSLLTTVLQHFKRFKVDGTSDTINCITDDGRNATVMNNDPVAAPNKSVIEASDIMVLKNPSGRELENAEFTIDVNLPTEQQLQINHCLDPPSKKRKADHSLPRQHKENIMDNGVSIVIEASDHENIVKFQFPLSLGMIDLENEIKKRLKSAAESFEIKYQNEHDECILLSSDADLQNVMCNMVSKKKNTVKLLLQSVQNQHSERRINSACPVPQTMEKLSDSIMTIKATYKEDMIKFQLPFHSGLLELNGEVLKRLKFKGDSFKIKYPVENNECINVDCDADLQKCMNIARSLENPTVRLLIEPLTDHIPKENAPAIPLSAARATEMQSGSKMIIIKATYKEDMIKFQLCPSSGMMDLKNEVTKRLKVSSESFRVKYQDAVDDDWFYISDDEGLQNYLSAMGSNKSAIKFHLEPIKN